MATKKRLIDADAFKSFLCKCCNILRSEEPCEPSDCNILAVIDEQPTVDAVEVSRLGKLGQLMIPYTGCPRGMIGERGEDGTDSCHLTELDAITDVDGNRWIPVFENDLSQLKAKADAVEVVHGRWLPDMEEFDDDPAVGIRGGVFQTGWKCSICGRTEQTKEPYCNCGAKMDLEVDDG